MVVARLCVLVFSCRFFSLLAGARPSAGAASRFMALLIAADRC
jgi:hypothetical protein